MTTGRNDPCPCGSGEKYKRCHAGKRPFAGFASPTQKTIIGIVALTAAAGVLALALNRQEDPPLSIAPSAAASAPATAPVQTATSTAQTPATTAAPPPDVAIPGRVWSPEHNHWHNATASENPIVIETENNVAPKVVSVPRPQNSTVTYYPQPEGPVPAGKVWSPLHGHWHDAPAEGTAVAVSTAPPVMNVPQPAGPVPPGKVWSREHGHWHNAPTQ